MATENHDARQRVTVDIAPRFQPFEVVEVVAADTGFAGRVGRIDALGPRLAFDRRGWSYEVEFEDSAQLLSESALRSNGMINVPTPGEGAWVVPLGLLGPYVAWRFEVGLLVTVRKGWESFRWTENELAQGAYRYGARAVTVLRGDAPGQFDVNIWPRTGPTQVFRRLFAAAGGEGEPPSDSGSDELLEFRWEDPSPDTPTCFFSPSVQSARVTAWRWSEILRENTPPSPTAPKR